MRQAFRFSHELIEDALRTGKEHQVWKVKSGVNPEFRLVKVDFDGEWVTLTFSDGGVSSLEPEISVIEEE